MIDPVKGQIFLLRNMRNESEVCSWIPPQSNPNLPQFVGHVPGTYLFQLSDGTFWYFLDDQPEWNKDDQILVTNDWELADGEHWLINIDHPEHSHFRAREHHGSDIPF